MDRRELYVHLHDLATQNLCIFGAAGIAMSWVTPYEFWLDLLILWIFFGFQLYGSYIVRKQAGLEP